MYDITDCVSNAFRTEPGLLRIKLLGDSITHGVGGTGFAQDGAPIVAGFFRNPHGFCWANLLKDYLEKHYNCCVTNNACSDTTIEFILEHYDVLVEEEDDLVICMIGTNNRRQYYYESPHHTREEHMEEFYHNILKLHQHFVDTGKQVIFVAGIPASAENEKDGENYWRLFHMDDVCTLYQRASKESGFLLISLFTLFEDYCKENGLELDSLLSDGLHPNDAGYEVMFKLMKRALLG